MFWRAFKKEIEKIAQEISQQYILSDKEKELIRKSIQRDFPEFCLETPKEIREHRRTTSAYARAYRRWLADQRRPKTAQESLVKSTKLPIESLSEHVKLRRANTKAKNRARASRNFLTIFNL